MLQTVIINNLLRKSVTNTTQTPLKTNLTASHGQNKFGHPSFPIDVQKLMDITVHIYRHSASRTVNESEEKEEEDGIISIHLPTSRQASRQSGAEDSEGINRAGQRTRRTTPGAAGRHTRGNDDDIPQYVANMAKSVRTHVTYVTKKNQ